jgi:hypothetical protein
VVLGQCAAILTANRTSTGDIRQTMYTERKVVAHSSNVYISSAILTA